MTTSPGPSTRSITVRPGIASPSAHVARRFSITRSLSSRSIESLIPNPRSRPLAAAEVALLIAGLGCRPLHLPAGRPADRAAADDRDLVDVEPEQVADLAADLTGQHVGCDGAARLHDDHDAIGPAAGRGAECDHPSAPYAADPVNRPLEILRMVLAAVDDDDVFRPAADEQLAARQVPEVPRVQPPPTDRLCGQRILLIVAQHHGWAGEEDLADTPLSERLAVVAGNLQPVPPQRRSAADQRDPRPLAVVRGRDGARREIVRRHDVGPRTTPARRKRRGEDVLRQPVAGQKAGVAKTGGGEF